jgi:AcrR family transcriptional regulator
LLKIGTFGDVDGAAADLKLHRVAMSAGVAQGTFYRHFPTREHLLVEYARVKRAVMTAIEASAWRDLYSGQHHRLDETLGMLLDRGKAAGQVREEVDAADVILLLGALSRIPASEWDTRAATIVAVIIDGLRPRL